MIPLQCILQNKGRFACGIELLTTRGTMDETQARRARALGQELAGEAAVDWVSITDNAGGNPQLSAVALGKPLLYAGKEVVIHLSCKDFNRNGLESAAWMLASEGFENILALTGDYPISGYSGRAKPVFDIDSIGLLTLLTEMNQGLGVSAGQLRRTDFYLGAVATNFKLHENEVVPQYLKLRKKIQAGARFIINQIGFDARKYSEMIGWMRMNGCGDVPLIGNVFLLNDRLARFFHHGRIPGVVVSDDLLRLAEERAQLPDKGRGWFLEFAAKQMAIFRGLGYAGVYLGGIEQGEDLRRVLAIEKGFASGDWKEFTREIQFSRPGEFFYFDRDPESGLCDFNRANRSLEERPAPDYQYKFSRWFHDHVFTRGHPLHRLGQRIYGDSEGPRWLRAIEHASKSALFACRDCGDCSLPETAYLCPESACAKNQRNGPCGGTRDGKCEVEEFDCIWARAYDRLKSEGRALELLDHATVIQDQGLRGTSSWANAFRGLDHHQSQNKKPRALKPCPSEP